MSKLGDALRKKFSTPREAIKALGLDESLLSERAHDSVPPQLKEKTMSKKVLLSRMGTVAYGALSTFIQPQLAMDAKIDLTKGLRNIRADNFKAKRGVLLEWLDKSLEGKLAQDGSIKAGLDAVLDMIEGMPKAEDEFPDAEKKEDKAEDEMADEDADMADDEEDEEAKKKAEAEKAAKDKKAKDKKAKDKKMGKDGKPMAGAKDKDVNEEDEDNEKDGAFDEDDDGKAMDAKIQEGVTAGVKKERLRMEAISAAKDHVRPIVGNLTMAFDSAGDVFRKAIKMRSGRDAPKGADVESLKFAYDSLPVKKPQRELIAMDGGDKQPAELASLDKLMARIGTA